MVSATLLLLLTAFLGATAELQQFFLPGQRQLNNQYLSPESHQSGLNVSLFGQRRTPSNMSQNRHSDTIHPSAQYGNPITGSSRTGGSRNSLSGQNIPSSKLPGQQSSYQPTTDISPKRSKGRGIASGQINKPGIQYANIPGIPNKYGNPNSFSKQYGVPKTFRSGSSNSPSSQHVPSSTRNRLGIHPLQSQYGTPDNVKPRYAHSHSSSGQYGTPNHAGYQGPMPSSHPAMFDRLVSMSLAQHSKSHPISGSLGFTPSREHSSVESTPFSTRKPIGGNQKYSSHRETTGSQNSPRTPSALYNSPPPVYYGVSSNGHMQDDLSEPANYEFMYEVQDAESGNDFGHMQKRHEDDADGMYYVMLPDGRTQVVQYKANPEGYKPMVHYEETANSGLFSFADEQGPY